MRLLLHRSQQHDNLLLTEERKVVDFYMPYENIPWNDMAYD